MYILKYLLLIFNNRKLRKLNNYAKSALLSPSVRYHSIDVRKHFDILSIQPNNQP
jgi:hypothetical protein